MASHDEAETFLREGSFDMMAGNDDNIREQSTTVKVLKTGSSYEPIEIMVERSTIKSGDTEESESDFSDEASGILKSKNLRFRRKRGESWKRDDNAGQIGDDDGKLEVDLKEERCDERGESVIKQTWKIKWEVQKFEYLPEWLQDNEYLRHGHRPPLPDFAECFRSILSIHTETGNIWTHLIGCVAFAVLALSFMLRTDNYIRFQDKIVFSFFFIGAVACLGMSFAFHTVSCHSVAVVRLFCKLDYLGISLLIVGSFIPWVYYGFYCRREPKITYITMVTILGVAASIVSLWDKFSSSEFRPIRAAVFVTFGLSGLIPSIHYAITDGFANVLEKGFDCLILMAILYITGALLYATRTPERLFPGKCDIWFQSHQIFHICVVVAALVHYYGITNLAMMRLKSSCPAESGASRVFQSFIEGVRKAVNRPQ